MDVQKLYNQRFEGNKAMANKNAIWNILCAHFLQKYVSPEAMVVDIAAGYCEFINNIKAREKIAFDLNPDIKLFADETVQIYNRSFFEMEECLAERKTDIIFASNIFEHLRSKEEVITAIQQCAKILKSSNAQEPGGKLLILQPNIKYTKGAYWDFIDHKVPLTDKALIEAGKMCGLKTILNIPRFLPYTTKSHVPQHPFLIWLYLKFMPVSGWVMGQQSFLIMEKTNV